MIQILARAMGLGSCAAPVPPVHYKTEKKLLMQSVVYRQTQLRFPRKNRVAGNKQKQVFAMYESSKFTAHCGQVEVEDDMRHEDEACELVNGIKLTIGDEPDGIQAYLFQAVKNNNETGILLLSDMFGLDDSATRDFAYRVACNGYNVLVPDLFEGDSWTKGRPDAHLEQWITRHSPERTAEIILASAKWMINEFAAVGISNKLGIIGFCYGGGRVIDILAQDQGSYFGCGISFYSRDIEPSVVGNVKVPLLLITGENDPFGLNSVFEEETKRNEEIKMVVFPRSGHGFVHRPQTPDEDEDAEDAFIMMRNWLYDGLVARS